MPISTGRLWASGAIRKCSSIARKPASRSRKSSGPIAIISDSPIAESIEYRPPTQSQNPNMFVVSMPNSRTLSALVDTATKCFATAASSCSLDNSQLPGRPGVGQGLEGRERLAADDEQRLGGIEVPRGRADVDAVDVRHEPERAREIRVLAQGLGRHRGSEVGAADADVDHVPDRLPREPGPLVVADAHREGGHPIEDRMDLGDDVLAVDEQALARGRTQGRVEDRPILGRVDALSREHRRPPLLDPCRLGDLHQEIDRVRGRPMLRVVEEDPRALGHHPARPVRVRGEQVAQVDVPQHGVVERERLPLGGLVDRRLVGAHGLGAYTALAPLAPCPTRLRGPRRPGEGTGRVPVRIGAIIRT